MYGSRVTQGAAWTVHFTSRDVARPAEVLPWLRDLPEDLTPWLDEAGLPDGLPFLLSPRYEYDVVLNSYFHRVSLIDAPWNSNANRARVLAAFLNFLHRARGGKSWRQASESDHLAFHQWRRRDPAGPRDEGGERIEWLPPASYRLWRDVGLRGYGPDGLPSDRFKGRWPARNATFTDLMARTGMRLSEQASLTVMEMPLQVGMGGYQRFWLPGAIAKYFSARWVYVPHSVVRELAAYAELDRAEVVQDARAAGRYDRWRRTLGMSNTTFRRHFPQQ